MSREIIEAVRAIEREKGIEGEALLTALEDALLAAYKKTPDAVPFAKVEIDREEGVFRIHQFVGEELPDDALILLEPDPDKEIRDPDAGPRVNPETGEIIEEEDDIDFDIDWSKVPMESIDTIEVTPEHSFGRIAAQTAKQVILQRIREAERGIMYEEYIDRVGDLINGIVQSSERNVTLVELKPGAEAILPGSESIPGERPDHGARIKAIILEVRDGSKGPQIVLSRASDELIRRLFELEVPEVGDGLVTIRSVAREPGYRSKIAVESSTQGVDPVGACVGPRGSRVRMVVSELRGEKIDIIPYNDEPARFIAKALSPARVREVLVDDDNRQATVIVPDDQFALAIGREGQNVRLAAKLTGWRIDIRSATEFSEEDIAGHPGGGMESEEEAGRCKAIMKTGKRCPNMAIEGSSYCSLPNHQALEGQEGNQVDGGAPEKPSAEQAAEPVAEAEPTVEAEPVAEAPAEEEPQTEEVTVPDDSGDASEDGDGGSDE
jgi:N utilization substance protein A